MADNDCPDIPEIPKLPNIPDGIEEIVQSAQKSISAVVTSGLSETIEQIGRAFSNCADGIFQVFSQAMHDYWSSHAAMLQEATSRLAEVVANFKIPTLTDEEAEQLVESNRIWGQYGWTYMPSMPIVMFDTPPADIKEANKAAMRYCSNSEMNKLFAKLQEWDFNKKDLESAVFCYQNRQYKACALLLCGLIDSKLIRVRSDDKRPTGERAVKNIKDKYDGSGEKILAEAMFTYNLLAYLEMLFSKANGFKNEPDTLNRNYIGHGMNRRTVRKRDCIQLFLALNNLMQFFDLQIQ